jgi:hypothetical protein
MPFASIRLFCVNLRPKVFRSLEPFARRKIGKIGFSQIKNQGLIYRDVQDVQDEFFKARFLSWVSWPSL